MLVLELLGTLSLRDDASPVPLAALQKRRVGLLAILALGGKQGLSRHRIEAFLWPESSADRARHALDQGVYAVRHALAKDVIVSAGQELRLNPDLVCVDAWKFDEAVRASDWSAAAGIYKGTLLDGFHFGESYELESWIDAERARLLRDYQTAIEVLADRSALTGDHLQDVAWRRRLASSDPLSAGPTKKLILALAAAGDRAGAVKQARQYQELVRHELEMEPDAEIEGLVSALSHPSSTHAAASSSQGAQDSIVVPTGAPLDFARGRLRATEGPALFRTRLRMERSRVAALTSVLVIGALIVGALVAANARPRSPRGAARLSLAEARQAYLHGITVGQDKTKEGLEKAIVSFRRATELDPEYAEAYAELAEAYVRLGYFGYRPADAMFPKAKAAALLSMRLDSMLASAHIALATDLIWEHDFAGAEREYRTAISLEETNALAHQWYGVLLMILRRVPESVAEERRAADLDPLGLQVQNNYATFLNAAGDHVGALRHFQKMVGEEPDSAWVRKNPWVLSNMARVFADNGQFANAVHSMKRALEIVPRNPRALHTMAEIYDDMGRSDLAHEAYAGADTSNEQYAAYLGMIYAQEGKADSAFLWFGRAKTWGIQPMLSIQANRHVDGVRKDPRYRALLTRLQIP
jgi:DNA-binding SARP family transcriptional activator